MTGELEVREVVKLYELREKGYREASKLLCHGISEPVDCKERVHGLFASEDRAKQRLDYLVEQRIQEGYSRPNCVGGEQTRVEHGQERNDNTILCINIGINPLEVDRQEITRQEGKIMYKGIPLE